MELSRHGGGDASGERTLQDGPFLAGVECSGRVGGQVVGPIGEAGEIQFLSPCARGISSGQEN